MSSSSALCRTLVFDSLDCISLYYTRLYRKVCSLLIFSMDALVGRRLLLLFQALERERKRKKSSSDPVRPFVRVCIYKETSSSFASTMPPTRTQKKRNKIKSFFSHRIYFTLCVCVYLLHGRDSRVKTLCCSGIFFSDCAVAPEELDRPSRDGSKQRIVLPFSGHATFLE